MEQSQELSGEEKLSLADDVNASLGLPNDEGGDSEPNELPEFAKKKLGMQEKRHKKQLRQMQQQIAEMQSRLEARTQHNTSPYENDVDDYQQPDAPMQRGQAGDPIYQAVAKALQMQQNMQKEQERKAAQAEKMQQVQRQYKALEDHLENYSSKYDDFDDVVKSEDAPYSSYMRDAALLIPNAAETLYHLGKDRKKLEAISKLDPIDQAKEVVKMSIALMGGTQKSSSNDNSRPLGSIKNNPVNNPGISENTSVSDLRKRMKEGTKWGK